MEGGEGRRLRVLTLDEQSNFVHRPLVSLSLGEPHLVIEG